MNCSLHVRCFILLKFVCKDLYFGTLLACCLLFLSVFFVKVMLRAVVVESKTKRLLNVSVAFDGDFIM